MKERNLLTNLESVSNTAPLVGTLSSNIEKTVLLSVNELKKENERLRLELTRVESELTSLQQRHQQFLDEDLTGDYIATVDGKLLACNPAFARIFGFNSVEDALGINLNCLYPPERSRNNFIQLVCKKKKLEFHQAEYLTIHGKRVFVVENVIGKFSETGELLEIKGYIFDDTKHMELEERLLQSQKMQGLGTLAGGIAHDFNNILAIILGHTFLLERSEAVVGKMSKGVESIKQAAQRGVALIQQLLTFARKTDIVLESIHANETVHEVVKLVSETFPKIITISLRLEKDLPQIVADPNQLHQVLLNLCINARDAMYNGGVLSISTSIVPREAVQGALDSLQNEYVCISVADTGIGMDEATRSRIFEPFFTTKERGKGTGLGLATVYGIVESHHGFINVDSTPGKGTTFRVYLPVAGNSTEEYTLAQASESDAPEGNETVLIVEDETMLLDLLKSVFLGKGYKVLSATNGEEAIGLYLKHRKEIAAIISDIGLPVVDGIGILKKIRAVDRDVKIILASGFIEPDTKAEVLEIGVEGLIQKPYLPNQLVQKVREVLDCKESC